MKESKAIFYSSKFPWTRERNSIKFIDNLDMRPQKRFANAELGFL
jgi:hypothetical protein